MSSVNLLVVALILLIIGLIIVCLKLLVTKHNLHREKAITEQQAATLRKIDQHKTAFFDNVAHELRTPATLLLSPIDALLNNSFGDLSPESRSILMMMQRNGSKLQNLLDEILDISKLDFNQARLNETSLYLYPLIANMFGRFNALALQKEIDFQLDFNVSKELLVQLDTKNTEKVLNNLLTNAFKYTPPKGTITLFVEQSKSELIFSVTDTGFGIHPNDLPFIFDRFYQAKHMEASHVEGVGIGLALCKEIAQLMLGNLSVESTLGKGSKFSFSIPLKTGLSAEAGLVNQIETPSSTTPEKIKKNDVLLPTVVVVEDNIDLRMFLIEFLSPFYEVIGLQNGLDAWNWLCQEQVLNRDLPHLVISDIKMPEMDGFQLLEKIRNSKLFCSIPMLMITARKKQEDKMKALLAGVDDYLTKPFAVDELLIRTAKLVENTTSRSNQNIAQYLLAPHSNAPSQALNEADTTPTDLAWLKKVEVIAKANINKGNFNLLDLANLLSVSERQLFRRIKRATNLTPNKYLREIKLQTAKDLLEQQTYQTVAEVAYAVGYDKSDYFSKLYLERFGKKPSEYLI